MTEKATRGEGELFPHRVSDVRRAELLGYMAEARALHDEIRMLLGVKAGNSFLHDGKVFDSPRFSGQYISGLADDADGRAFIRDLLRRLAAGELVPVMLMNTYCSGMRPTEFPELQLDASVLYRVFPDGRREPV